MTTRAHDARKERAGRGRVAEEIRQNRPFESPEREMAVTLLRTGDTLHHAVESVLRRWEVSPEQYNVLRILRGAERDGLPTLEIAERMIARSPNITRMTDKMVLKGLAERRRVEGDRRVVRIRTTAAGRKVLAELDRAVDRLLTRLRSMKATELRTLVALLDSVRECLAVPTAREGMARKAGRDAPRVHPVGSFNKA